jgi:hypothetical protein
MAPRLRLSWDREGDILAIDTGIPPHAQATSDFIEDDVWARWNPETGDIERLEILSFSRHFDRLGDYLALPVTARLICLDGVAHEV